jgi:pyrroloquinoline quinone biosynthesis protein D
MSGVQNTIIDRIPIPAAHVEMEVVEDEVLLYHPQHTRAVYLNPTAAAIWGLCDGSRSVREIIRIVGESYPEADSLSDDVLATLHQLQESGILVVG